MIAPARPTALVTGGSRGIGLGIARHLAGVGWHLTLAARGEAQLASVKSELMAIGARVETVTADMAIDADLGAVVEHHRATYGSMNALILAAGVGSAGPLDGYPARRLDKQLAVNFRAPFSLISQSSSLLRKAAAQDPQVGSRVIALSSIEGMYPEAGLAAYGASKAALVSLMRSVNAEWSGEGVTATAISPAFVDTEMSAWVSDRIPRDTMVSVTDVVKVVGLLLSLSPTAVIPHVVMNRAGADAYHA